MTKPLPRLIEKYFATKRPDAVTAVLQKAGNQGLTLEKLKASSSEFSRSKADRALRKLWKEGRVEKNGDRWKLVDARRLPKTK